MESGVARKTISDFELGLRQPQIRTRRDLLRAFGRFGVRFRVTADGAQLELLTSDSPSFDEDA